MPKTSQAPVKQGAPAIIHMKKGDYLKRHLSSLPAGMIDKRYPGIGATTLEIEDSSRNSIIVFPTRALAATKAKSKGIHYYGSAYPGVRVSSIEDITEDIESGVLTKIAIVADSLVGVYDRLKDVLFAHDFFIVLDEIDSFQTESSYRPKLEESIDIYLQFPADRRCLVSATLEQFSDKRLKSEPISKIVIDDYAPPKVKVINATKSVIKVAAEQITEVASRKVKVFVAFNSIEGIRKVISLLSDDIKSRVGILCSPDSHNNFNLHQISGIKDGILQHGITFLTSAYFVGLDVLEPKNSVAVIIVADTKLPVSLLPDSKIRQIFGRIRFGSASNTLILNCTDKLYLPLNNYRQALEQRKKVYEKVLETIHSSFDTLNLREEGNEIKNIMLDTCRIDNVCLLRRLNDRVVVSASNFDYLRIRYTALKLLYSEFRNTIKNLKKYFKVRQETIHTDLSQTERLIFAEVEALLQNEKLSLMRFILDNYITDPRVAKGKESGILIQIWGNSSDIIDKSKVRLIIEALPELSVKELNKILFQVKAFSEQKESLLWKHMDVHFQIGNRYSSEEIFKSFSSIVRAVGYGKSLGKYGTRNQTLQRLKLLYETKKVLNKNTRKYEFLIVSTYRNKFCK